MSAPAAEVFWAAVKAARASILAFTAAGSPPRLQFIADCVAELSLRSGALLKGGLQATGESSPGVKSSRNCAFMHGWVPPVPQPLTRAQAGILVC